MDDKETIKNINTTQRLVQIDDYYKHVFKKTEKIVSVVFYISNKISKRDNNNVFNDVVTSARETHNVVLKSLDVRLHVAEEELRSIAHKLIELESKIRVAESAGCLNSEAVSVLANEIELILRHINNYLKSTSAFDDVNYGLGTWFGSDVTSVRNPRPSITEVGSSHKTPQATYSKTTSSRRDRIMTVLKTAEEATIKDIAEVIKDCSEKTLQRELNSMIEANIVNRIGEKRWSRYTLV